MNVFSQFWCIYEFLPRMLTLNMVKNSFIMMDNIDTLAIRSPQGHIVSMSSMAGVTGTPNLVPYCASKVFFFHVAPLSANYTLMVIDNDNILVCSERHDGGPLS